MQKTTQFFTCIILLLGILMLLLNHSENNYDFDKYSNIVDHQTTQEIYSKLKQLEQFQAYHQFLTVPFYEPQDVFNDADFVFQYELYIKENSLESDLKYYREAIDYLTQVNDYPSYVDSVRNNIQEIKLQPYWNSYSDLRKNYYENLDAHYIALESLELPVVNYQGLELFEKTNISLLIVTVGLMMTWSSFKIDSYGNMDALLFVTPKGKTRTTVHKLFAILCSSFLVILLLNIILGTVVYFIYDIPPITTPIQSIPTFYSSPYNITVGTWFLIKILLQVLGTFSLSLIFGTLTQYFKSESIASMVYLILIGLSLILYGAIDDTGVLYWVRYILPISMIKTPQVLYQYNLIEIGGIALSQIQTIILSNAFYIIIATVWVIHGRNRFDRITFEFKMPVKIFRKMRLVGFEIYKLFIMKKGVFVLLLFVIIQGYFSYDALSLSNLFIEEKDLVAFYQDKGGVLDAEKINWIEKQQEQNEIETDNILNLSNLLERGEITEKEYELTFLKYYESSEFRGLFNQFYNDYNETLGNNLIYKKGYHVLFSTKTASRDFRNAILVTLSLILILSPTYVQDDIEDMGVLHRLSLFYGSKQFKIKVIMGTALGSIMVFFQFFVELFTYNKLYPMVNWNAKMISLYTHDFQPTMSWLQDISIIQYVFVLMFLRLITILLITLIILFISKKSKTMIQSYLFSFIVLVLPLVISYLSEFDMSLITFLMGNHYLFYGFNYLHLMGMIVLVVLLIHWNIKET